MANKKEDKAITLKLLFSDRAFRISILYPKETNILNGLILKDIVSKLMLSSSEVKKFDIKPDDKGGVQWKKENDKVKSISFTSAEMQFLKDQVSIFDKQNKITQDLLDVVLKIQEVTLT